MAYEKSWAIFFGIRQDSSGFVMNLQPNYDQNYDVFCVVMCLIGNRQFGCRQLGNNLGVREMDNHS